MNAAERQTLIRLAVAAARNAAIMARVMEADPRCAQAAARARALVRANMDEARRIKARGPL